MTAWGHFFCEMLKRGVMGLGYADNSIILLRASLAITVLLSFENGLMTKRCCGSFSPVIETVFSIVLR